MLLTHLALAFTPTVTTAWESDATTLRVLQGPAGARVVSAGTGIEVRDGAGTLEARADLVATAVGVADLYDDGTIELLACTADGLFALSWTDSGLGSPLTIESAPCTTITEVEGGFLVGGDPSRAWTVDGVRTELPLTIGQNGVLVSAAGVVWGMTPGTTTLYSWDGTGVTATETTALGGLAEVAGTVSWTLRTDALLATSAGTTPLLADPANLLAADADLNGVQDAVILHPARGSIGVLLAGESAEVELPELGAPIALAAGTLDGACPSLLVADGLSITRADDTDCSPETDGDGDDWSTGDGDCNDDDATIHPGAEEACNRIDDNCDGQVDELSSVAVTASTTDVSEGETSDFSVTHDGCDTPAFAFTVSGSREDDCVTQTDGVSCTWTDDGDVTVSVSATAGATEATDSTSLRITNVDPDVVAPECGGSAWSVTVGELRTDRIDVEDVPADTVSCYVLAGPPGLLVNADCTVDWTVTDADVGVWAVQLMLRDEDGGATLVSQDITVNAGGCGSGCGGSGAGGCASGGATSPVGALLIGALLRRRRVSA